MLSMGLPAAPMAEGTHKAAAAAAPSAGDPACDATTPAGAVSSAGANLFQALIAASSGQGSTVAAPAPASEAVTEDVRAVADADGEAGDEEVNDERPDGLSLIENLLQWLRGPTATPARAAAGRQMPTPELAEEVAAGGGVAAPLAQAASAAAVSDQPALQTAADVRAGNPARFPPALQALVDPGARLVEDTASQEGTAGMLPARLSPTEPLLLVPDRPVDVPVPAPATDVGPMSVLSGWTNRPFDGPPAPPVQAPLPPAPGSPLSTALADWPQALGERIAWSVDGDLQDAVIELHPAELGSLTIRVETRGADAQVTLIAGTAAARDLLQQSLPQLRELMMGQGLNLARAQVERPTTGSSSEAPASARGRNAGPTGSRRRISQLLLVDAYA